VQEIARSRDEPRSRALDLSGRAAFGDHPLGWNILGTRESLTGLGRDEVLAFRSRTWSPARGCALIVGNDSSLPATAELEELLDRLPQTAPSVNGAAAPAHETRVLVEERDSSQSHVVLSWRVDAPVEDPRVRSALTVYAMMLGGSMGSRLVTEIREERGWAYSVRAEPDPLSDAAVVYVTAGLESTNAVEATERMQEIVAELAQEGPSEDEFERARSAAAGRRALAFENTTMAAIHLAEELLIHGHQTDPEDAVASLDSVKLADVVGVAQSIGQPAAVACVGPHTAAEFAAAAR
jgi:predicted Zn-dependent peptidase